MSACKTGLGSFTPSTIRTSAGSIRNDSIQQIYLTQYGHNSSGIAGEQKTSTPHEPTVHTYTQSRYDHFLPSHRLHVWQNIHNVCVYGICFWHHSHLLSFGWSSLLSVPSSLDSLVPPQFPLFKAAPFDSELFCAWLHGFLCFFSSCFSCFSSSRYLFSSWHLALSSAFLFCSSFFFSLSCFRFSFSSSSCFFFKAFSSRILRESALVRTLAPETVWEDFLDFGVSGAGLTR